MNKQQTRKWIISQIQKANREIDRLIIAGKPYNQSKAYQNHRHFRLQLAAIDAR